MTAGGSSTLVCFALPEEARPFRRRIKPEWRVRVLVTGMGRRNTEHALARSLDDARPDLVLTCGFAGGLAPDLAHNTVVFSADDETLSDRLAGFGFRRARFHCATRMAVTAEQKTILRRDTGADVVEMESGWARELCRSRGVPCATIRVISDTAEETMPLDFNQLVTPEMKLSFAKLALAIGKSPGKIGALLRLQRQTAAAASALADALGKIVIPPPA